MSGDPWDALEPQRPGWSTILTIAVLGAIVLGAFALLPWSVFGGLPPEIAFDELDR